MHVTLVNNKRPCTVYIGDRPGTPMALHDELHFGLESWPVATLTVVYDKAPAPAPECPTCREIASALGKLRQVYGLKG